MSNKPNLDAILSDLQIEVAQKLLDKVKSGDATAADLNVARQLLKDNQITALPSANKPMFDLASALPFPTGVEDLQ